MKFIILTLLLTLFSFKAISLDTKANQAIVFDYNTNEILFEKNSRDIVPPASMTKIMTVYAAFDRITQTNLSINDLCVISPRAYKMGGSRTFLEIDDKVSIDDLLKGIIVQSGNDASVALAECLAGTESDFAVLMNNYGKKIGLENTNFINSSGWPEKNHYSTVYDIALISNALIRDFPNLYSYFKLKDFLYNNINQPNRNRLLNNLEGADGLKTGFTKESGWGISASAKKNNRRITVVINGTNSSRSRLNESLNLFNWAFNQTSEKKLFKKNQFIKKVDVWLGNKSTVNLVTKDDVISILSFDQLQMIESQIYYQKPIPAPIKKGDQFGEIKIFTKGKETIIVPLVAESNVNNINPFLKAFAALKYLIFGTSLDEI